MHVQLVLLLKNCTAPVISDLKFVMIIFFQLVLAIRQIQATIF